MLIREILNEVSHVDLYPKSFQDFRKKYLPWIADKTLYVNFTDAVGNSLDKSFSPNPTHADMSGLYGYPLEYVLNHPADIEYGQQAKHLRVIQDTSKSKLVLTHMTAHQAVDILFKMGIDEPEKKMAYVQRSQKYSDGNKVAKQFLGVLQWYRVVGQKSVTPNAEQTRLLLKAGIDAVEDQAKTSTQAVIYRAEPEQIVFLTRSAFKIMDIFDLRSEKSRNMNYSDPRQRLKSLPGMIAHALGDRIVANNMSSDREAAMTFYTAAKRKIVVEMSKEYRFSKSHREYGEQSPEVITVTLAGPDFKTIKHVFEPDVTFQNMALFFKNAFTNRAPAKGIGYDLWLEHGADIDQTIQLFSTIANKLKMPFTIPFDKPTMWRVYSALSGITLKLFDRVEGTKKAYQARVAEKVDQYFPERVAPQANQIVAIYDKVLASRVPLGSVLNLKQLADTLKIRNQSETDVKPETKTLSKSYGDFTVFREGTALKVTLAGKTQKIAEINNSVLEGWQKPDGHNQRLFLDHAAGLADFLNENHFVVTGYPTYLAQFYDLVYTDGVWKVLDDVTEPMESIGDVKIFKAKLSDRNDFTEVFASIDGEHDFRPSNGPGGAVEQYRCQEPLLTLNDKNEIVNISENMRGYLSHQKREKDKAEGKQVGWYGEPRYSHMYSGEESGKILWNALIAGGFDPKTFIQQQGYGFSPYVNSGHTDVLELFGLKLNKDNGKIGKSYAEIAKPVGEFAGLLMYSLVIKTDSGKRRYIFIQGKTIKTAVMTELDHISGQRDIKVVSMADDLTPEQRLATKALLINLELALPTKFKANLTVKVDKTIDKKQGKQ